MVWSISQQKHVHTLRGHVDEIEVITHTIVLFILYLWAMEGSVIVGCLQCMAHSGYTVVTGSWDKALMVWDIRQEDAVQMLHGHREGKSNRRMLYRCFIGTEEGKTKLCYML